MRGLNRLRGRTGVVLDTMLFVYLFEDTPGFAAKCEAIVEHMARGLFTGVVTPITTAELLVKPIREKRPDLAMHYRNALAGMPNLVHSTIDHEIGAMAGALRAKYRLPLPDLIQVASALKFDHPTLVTNDRALRHVSEVDVLLLESMRG